MHIDWNDVLHQAAPTLQTIATGTIAAVAAKGFQSLHKFNKKVAVETARHLAETFVLEIEQRFGTAMDNAEKRKTVMEKLRKALPWVPEFILDAALESAVVLAKKNLPKSAPAYITPSPTL